MGFLFLTPIIQCQTDLIQALFLYYYQQQANILSLNLNKLIKIVYWCLKPYRICHHHLQKLFSFAHYGRGMLSENDVCILALLANNRPFTDSYTFEAAQGEWGDTEGRKADSRKDPPCGLRHSPKMLTLPTPELPVIASAVGRLGLSPFFHSAPQICYLLDPEVSPSESVGKSLLWVAGVALLSVGGHTLLQF